MPPIQQSQSRSSRRRRSILIGRAAVAALITLVLLRPFSRYKLLRHVTIFSEADRIHNFRAMDELFPAHIVHRNRHPHRFENRPMSLPSNYVFHGQTHGFDEFFERRSVDPGVDDG